MKYSFSRLNRFDQCPLQWASRYGGAGHPRLPKMSSFPMDSGKHSHSVVANYITWLQANGLERDPEKVPELVEMEYARGDEVLSTETFEDVSFVAHRFAQEYVHDPRAFVGSEMFMARELPVEGGEALDVIGYPDLVYRGEDRDGSDLIVMRDFKTGYNADMTDAHAFQGRVYCWFGQKYFPKDRLAYEVHFVRSNVVSDRVTMKPWDYERVEARMRAIIARIDEANRTRSFPARPGTWCRYCDVAVRCAKRNVLVEAGVRVDDADSARAALEDVLVLEAALARRTEQLRDFTKTNGAVEVNGEAVGYWPKSSLAVEDAGALIEAVGLTAALQDGLIRPNGDKLKAKRWQNDPRVAPLYGLKRSTRFETQKVKDA